MFIKKSDLVSRILKGFFVAFLDSSAIKISQILHETEKTNLSFEYQLSY